MTKNKKTGFFQSFILCLVFFSFSLPLGAGEMICDPATGICRPAENWLKETIADSPVMDIPQPDLRLYGLISQEKLLNALNDRTQGKNINQENENFFSGKHSFLLYLLAALLGGFMLNFTPCVLPLLPVTLLIIQKDHEKSAGFRAILYAFGCTMACTLGGAAVILGGKGIQELSSSPLFTLICGIIFVILGSALFFNLDLNPLRKLPKITASGPFWLGILNTLLAGSCVAPVLLALLLLAAGNYAGDNDIKWFLLPAAFGIGMALPWWSAAALLPKLPRPGKWMTKVKNLLSLLIAVIGIAYCAMGIAAILSNSNGTDAAEQIISGIAESRQKKKPLLIKFSAANCGSCRVLDLTVWRKPLIHQALKKYVVREISLDNRNDKATKALMKHLNIAGVPAIFIWKN